MAAASPASSENDTSLSTVSGPRGVGYRLATLATVSTLDSRKPRGHQTTKARRSRRTRSDQCDLRTGAPGSERYPQPHMHVRTAGFRPRDVHVEHERRDAGIEAAADAVIERLVCQPRGRRPHGAGIDEPFHAEPPEA